MRKNGGSFKDLNFYTLKVVPLTNLFMTLLGDISSRSKACYNEGNMKALQDVI